MINIVLSPSQQAWNKCVMGDTEEAHSFAIAKLVGQVRTTQGRASVGTVAYILVEQARR